MTYIYIYIHNYVYINRIIYSIRIYKYIHTKRKTKKSHCTKGLRHCHDDWMTAGTPHDHLHTLHGFLVGIFFDLSSLKGWGPNL